MAIDTRFPLRSSAGSIVAALVAGAMLSDPVLAQSPEAKSPTQPPTISDTAAPLTRALTATLKDLPAHKEDEVPWRPATIAYAGADSAPAKLPLRVRTRGTWRLKTC